MRIRDKVVKLIQLQIDIHTCIKVNMELYATYSKQDDKCVKIYEIKSFNTKNVLIRGVQNTKVAKCLGEPAESDRK